MNPEEIALLSKLLASLSESIGASSPFTAGVTKNAKSFNELNKLHQKYSTMSEKELTLLKAKMDADKEYADQLAQKGAKVAAGAQQMASTLLDAVKGLSSMTNSVYNSDQSFTAVTPVLDMVGRVASGVVEAIGKMASGIPVIGGAIEGMSKLASVGIQMVVDAAKSQLENAQKMVNNFQNMSKVGANFGGSLEHMRKVATSAGMSVDTFGKFIAKNSENLAALSGNVVTGAERVGHLGAEIARTDKKLLAMYGSYDELAGGVSDYMALMNRYGANMNKSDKEVTAGARDYLYNMKELSELTGKSADALKKEQEARSNSLAYQMALSKMSETERLNTEQGLSMITAKYGKRAGEMAQEYVANGGKIMSQNGLKLASQFPELASAMKEIVGNTNMSAAEYNKQTAEIMQSHNDRIKGEVDRNAQLAQLHQAGVKDEAGIIEMVNEVGSTYYKSFNGLSKMVESQAEAEKARTEKITQSTKVYADTIASLEHFKIKMDELTEKNMQKLGPIMDNLYKIAEASAKMLDNMGPAFNKVLEYMTKAAAALAEKAGDKSMWEKLGDFATQVGKGALVGAGVGAAGGALIGGVGAVPGAIAGGVAGAVTGAAGYFMGGGGNNAQAGANQAAAAGLKVKPGDVTTGGASDQRTIGAAQIIQEAFGKNFGNFTSFKDAYHTGFPGSDHNQGLAFDFTTNPPPKDAKEAAMIKQKIKDLLKQANMDPRYVGDEYFADKVAGTTGGHFHVSLPKMAKGGITDGLSIAGEAGPEAVIPLPDGRSVPVKMDLADLLDKFDQMIRIMSDHKDVSEKHMKAAT